MATEQKLNSSNSGPYINSHIYSRDLIWIPKNDEQKKRFANNIPAPVHDDILIAKLRPGQEIELIVHCIKGIGKDHAKFSPVSTASYRLLPKIVIKEPIMNEDAEILMRTEPDVFDVKKDKKGNKIAYVASARNCTMSRNCLRIPNVGNKIELTRVYDHFIFSIESTGCLPPEDLFLMAIDVLKKKCDEIDDGMDEFDITKDTIL